MKYSSSLFCVPPLALLACSAANAATTITGILNAPTSSLATNIHSAPFPSTNLYDGTPPTLAQIGTNRANDGNEWAVANSSNGADYIVYDMGATVSFTSILYSQRASGETNPNWNWSTMTVWVSDTNPGIPNTDSGAGETSGDAARSGFVSTFTLAVGAAGQNLTQYDLTGDGSSVSGRYVTFKFNPVGGTANPGGQDLWLAVPEPGTALLAGLGVLGLLRRRR